MLNFIKKEDLVEIYKLNRITLLFPDDLENEFQDCSFKSSLSTIRIFLFIIVILYVIGNLIDIVTNTESTKLHQIGLMVIIPIFIGIIMSTYLNLFKKYNQFILSFTFMFSGFGLTLMLIQSPDNFIYAMGLMMVFSAGFFILNLKYIYATLTAIITMLLINLLLLLYSDIESYNMIAYNFFYSSIILISMIAAYSIELYQKRNFLQNKILNEEKKKLEAEVIKNSLNLHDTENMLNILFDNAFDGIYILDNTRYEYVNDSFCKITGFNFDELTHPNFDFNVLLTDKGKKFMEERYSLRRAGKELPKKYDIEIKSKDGIIKYLEVTTVSIGKAGQVRVFGIMRDISDKMKAELNLSEQNEFRKLLIEVSAKFINLAPKNAHKEINNSLETMSKFVKADRAYIFDLDYENGICNNTFEYCNEGIEPYIDELQNIKLGDDFLHNFGKKEIMYIPDVAKLPTGYTKEVLEPQGIKSLIAVPMLNESLPIGFVGFDFVNDYHFYSETDMQMLTIFSHLLVNIKLKLDNEKKLMLAKVKAEESDKLKTAFLSNLSHEIRTPMNGIIGFMNLLKLPDLTIDERNEYIKLINTSGKRLLNTLEDIIEISQIDTGALAISLEQVNLSDELYKIADTYEQKVKDKGLDYHIKIELPKERLNIYTDKHKLERIFYHLINNAIKFTNIGYIEIGAFANGNSINLYLKDTGVGIHSLLIDKVFDRFIQADLSISRPHEGSGLGLSIVKEYANMLNYQIKLESEQDKGSIIHIII